MLLLLGGLFLAGSPSWANDLADAWKAQHTGNHTEAARLAKTARETGERSVEWPLLEAQALISVGQYETALSVLEEAIDRDRRSPRLRWMAHQVQESLGQTQEAALGLSQILQLLGTRNPGYRQGPDLVAFGRAALKIGIDPKEVLERLYSVASRLNPEHRDSYLARGALALEKQDGALAAKAFQEGLEKFPEDPDFHHGIAQAYANSDRSRMASALEAALSINPRHAPSLLLLADHRLLAEDIEGAHEALDTILDLNSRHAEAWAYRAVLAHLRNDPEAEQDARNAALSDWKQNPLVDHRIGQKLSQKYRFAEGATHQRRALGMKPDYLAAKAQLASDLLRLGQDEEGWRLIQQVHEADGYHVQAYNLVTLQETMQKYATLTNEHFRVRMNGREARLYGRRVLDLLDQARVVLGEKYDLWPESPTVVEIFAEQKDFGVRTFGMPENPGYLGVCFGRVITANSPATRPGRQVNWESVLWHEFCHVITLQATGNKLPRWLSEGISVYEETEADPAWGQLISPRYREIILDEGLTPISRMSAAFLTPRSDFHLQLAYFQSGLVVEFLVERQGLETLRDLLRDLKEGQLIHDALESRYGDPDELENAFVAFAREKALAIGPELDWERPDKELTQAGREEDFSRWAEDNPLNYWGLRHRAAEYVLAGDWENALEPLETLATHYPEQGGSDSAHALLARAYRELGDEDAEIEALENHATWAADALPTYERLMLLGRQRGEWDRVLRNAHRYLAVNPLVALPHRQLADAAEHLDDLELAIETRRILLEFPTQNPSEQHFNLARLMQKHGDPDARRHLLEALSDAPRHRDGLALLLDLDAARKSAAKAAELAANLHEEDHEVGEPTGAKTGESTEPTDSDADAAAANAESQEEIEPDVEPDGNDSEDSIPESELKSPEPTEDEEPADARSHPERPENILT